ncbi:MAG: glycoside hydrolase family 95 protein [Cytophagales bacterium]|nr:glycoside hydrolase family 95 protein [Cytophagales bacterium]
MVDRDEQSRYPKTDFRSFYKDSLALWYLRPAQIWDEALPIGNGRLGAMVFAGLV